MRVGAQPKCGVHNRFHLELQIKSELHPGRQPESVEWVLLLWVIGVFLPRVTLSS